MIPDVIIFIPTIYRDSDSKKLKISAPKIGETIIITDKPISITPATILNILDAL
jgi:hypothetical protein